MTSKDVLPRGRRMITRTVGVSRVIIALAVLALVVMLAGGTDSYTVPRDNDILLADGFFKRMRDLFAERAYEDAFSAGGGGGGGMEMADEAVPQAPVDTSHLDSPPKPKVVEGWPKVEHSFGQVTAVTIDLQGNPVIFHRGSRTWTAESFNESNHYQQIAEGPIVETTIVTLAAADGAVLEERGAGIFYMPHGLTIDRGGNMWLTDVALHQAFKFMPGRDYPSITLGHRFEPGSSRSHLCKPTAVAVASTGEIFVADGYCNSRLLKYNAAGRLIRTIPQPPEFLSLQVPHGLTLLEHLDMVCVADRENMRVVCPRAGLQTSNGEGTQAATIQEPDLGRVFAVAAYGDLVYAVNGPTSPMIPVRGFTIDPRSETIIDHWGPQFENPHAITFCPNGSAMYVTEIGPNRVWKFSLAN